MNTTLTSIFFLFLLLVFEFFNDVIVKRWTEGKSNNQWLFLVFIIHLFVFAFWVLAMKYESFSKVISIYSVLGISGGIVLGYLLFNEQFSFLNWVGVGFGVVSIVLMGLK